MIRKILSIQKPILEEKYMNKQDFFFSSKSLNNFLQTTTEIYSKPSETASQSG